MAASAQAPARDSLSSFFIPVTLSVSPGLFGANAVSLYDGDDSDDSEYDSDDSDSDSDDSDSDDYNCSDLEDFLGELFGSLSTGSSSVRVAEKMDPNKKKSPVAVSGKWKMKRTAEGIHLRLDMPGLGKEDVKVTVKESTVSIKGEGKKDFEDDDNTGPGYKNTLVLSEMFYKLKEMKAEMKNGVLKVFVPKIKDEERGDAFDVSVE